MRKLERIMLVDDDSDTNFYNQLILEEIEASDNIVVFQNGEDALSYLKTGQNVDLILLDINMPLMSGWQFLEEYETLDDEMKATRVVVMLTASANIDDKKKAETYESVKRYINKPIMPEVIAEILSLFK